MTNMDVEPWAKQCQVPAFFLHASGDNFIVPSHSEKNHAAYGGANKTIKMCPGDHNTERPKEIVAEICQFIK